MKKIYVLIFAFCMFSLPLALAIGVSPSKASFDDLIKGETITSFGYISDIESSTIIASPSGDIASWIHIDNESLLNTQKNARVKVPFTINVPKETPNGKYTGSIDFTTQPINTQNSVSIKTIVPLNIQLTVVGEQVRSFLISKISIANIEEESPLHIFTTIDNKGNVIAQPEKISISIEDKAKNVIFETEQLFTQGVPPHKEGVILVELANTLKAGEYTVVSTIKDEGQIIFFESINIVVHEKGYFQKEATLKNIQLPLLISGDEILKIQAITLNNGDLPIEAKFIGEIYLHGKLIGVSESDYLTINPNDEKELVAFFQPKKKGDYNIVGKVVYDGKETTTTEEIFSVKEDFFNNNLFIGIFTIIVVSVALIAQTTRKKKNKKSKKVKK